MMYERKNNRGKIQIMGDVLALATSGIKKTHIMYRANLSYEQVHLYLGELIGKRLISQDVSPDGVVYRTTTKGREFLLYYTHLVEFLEEEPEVELSPPYVRRSWIRYLENRNNNKLFFLAYDNSSKKHS